MKLALARAMPVLYPMTLSKFVDIHPEAKHYYELKSSDVVFNLSEPGRLEVINSMTRRILTLDNATYTYTGASKPQLTDVTVKLCLASRVAVIGANGAGKSTLIKMLVQETSPDTGAFWKHHAVRVAYVAQHSFHHVEKHLESSPVEYFQWRFGGENGIDRELSDHVNLQQTEEEKKRPRRRSTAPAVAARWSRRSPRRRRRWAPTPTPT
jgi:elongation factor 3